MSTLIQKIAENLGYNVWSKNGLERIYMNDMGWNTKKVKTTAYVYQQDGELKVSVFVDCPTQTMSWINAEKAQITKAIDEKVSAALDEIFKTHELNTPSKKEYNKSRVMKTAHAFRKEGMSMSDALKKAWAIEKAM